MRNEVSLRRRPRADTGKCLEDAIASINEALKYQTQTTRIIVYVLLSLILFLCTVLVLVVV